MSNHITDRDEGEGFIIGNTDVEALLDAQYEVHQSRRVKEKAEQGSLGVEVGEIENLLMVDLDRGGDQLPQLSQDRALRINGWLTHLLAAGRFRALTVQSCRLVLQDAIPSQFLTACPGNISPANTA